MTEQILKRYRTLAPEVRVLPPHPYLIHALIEGKRDAIVLTYYRHGTVRLEYINNCGETEAELIISPEHTLAELTGAYEMTGLLLYVAHQIVPDLEDQFYADPDLICAKRSEIYQALVAGGTTVIDAIRQLEKTYYSFLEGKEEK
jgi:hypothetical protein